MVRHDSKVATLVLCISRKKQIATAFLLLVHPVLESAKVVANVGMPLGWIPENMILEEVANDLLIALPADTPNIAIWNWKREAGPAGIKRE